MQQVTNTTSSLLTYLQEVSGIKEKIDSTLARLSRLTVEDITVRDEGGFKRKMVLLECASLVHYRSLLALTLPQSS